MILSYTDKLLVFRWVQIVPSLWLIYLFLICFERDVMKDHSNDNQVGFIKTFNLTSRYLDDLLNIDNPYCEGMVSQIYPPELKLNKANTSDTETPFFDLHPSISNGFISSKISDVHFLDGDVPRRPSYGVYIHVYLNL